MNVTQRTFRPYVGPSFEMSESASQNGGNVPPIWRQPVSQMRTIRGWNRSFTRANFVKTQLSHEDFLVDRLGQVVKPVGQAEIVAKF